MQLDTCAPGQGGRVSRIVGAGPTVQRLGEMGIVEGADVRVVRVAPLGDPIEVELMGYRLTLRKGEARFVELEVTP